MEKSEKKLNTAHELGMNADSLRVMAESQFFPFFAEILTIFLGFNFCIEFKSLCYCHVWLISYADLLYSNTLKQDCSNLPASFFGTKSLHFPAMNSTAGREPEEMEELLSYDKPMSHK